MNINRAVASLADYGIRNSLIAPEDRTWAVNLILGVMKLDSYKDEGSENAPLEDILAALLDDACDRGLIGDNVTERDLFDTRLMSILTPRPSDVIGRFNELYEADPQSATDYFYKLCGDTDYIRRYRIKNDIKWITPTEYGDIDITINLAKPEKDPRLIKLAGSAKAGEKYPACMLCRENEGYAGRLDHPARQNLRMLPIKVAGGDWFFQYSPYVYFNEHSIFLNSLHIPMKIDREVFVKLLDIIDCLPHYFVGSNAGLPIVGGSILAHEHFQGGRYEFAMAKAPVETPFRATGFEDVDCGVVKWPMTCLRVASADRDRVVDCCDHILNSWKKYTDEDAFLFALTDGEEHNTVTPISRMRDGRYEIDLVLRNNITTPEYPDGVYHAHPEYHHIKRENIGLIEVMGLAVLPSRLKKEMEALAAALVSGQDISKDETLAKHDEWAAQIRSKYEITADNVDGILRDEIGNVFCRILENCGVFKRTEEGKAQLLKFLQTL